MKQLTVRLSKTASALRRPKLKLLVAAFAVAGSLTLAPLGLGGSVVSAQSATPTSRADCVNWRDYGFQNRGACVAFVSTQHANGYGGNGNGNGGAIGSIGRFIANILDAIARLVRAIFGVFF